MRLACSIAIRFLKSGKGQTILIALGIAIGVSVQIFIGLLITGLQQSLIDKTIGRSPQITVTAKEDGKTIPDAAALAAKIQGYGDEIVAAEPSSDGSAFLSFSDKTDPILFRGMDLAASDQILRIGEGIYEGRLPHADDEIIVGKDLAEKLALSSGDTVKIAIPYGTEKEYKVSGLYDLKVASINSSWIIGTLSATQAFFDYGSGVTSIGIKVKTPFEADNTATKLSSYIGDGNLTFTDWKTQNEQLLSGLNGQSISSIMIQVFVLVSVVLGIASVLAITVMQKSKQVGILKAMGITDRISSLVFLFQGLFLGLLGAVLGVLLGVGLCVMFVTFARNPDGTALIAISVDYGFIALSAGIAVLAAIVASLIPARKSSQLNPIEVIRNG